MSDSASLTGSRARRTASLADGKSVKGFRDVAIYKEDYAYYPDGHMGGAVSRPRSGWLNVLEPIGTSLYETKEWYENATNVIFTYGAIIQGLCCWYLISNESESLDLAGKLVKFILKPRFWKPEAEPECIVSEAHAHFEGHMHDTVRGLWGLLEYAILANDEKLNTFVRDGYNFVRTFGSARIGLVGEGCTVGDMAVALVRSLSEGNQRRDELLFTARQVDDGWRWMLGAPVAFFLPEHAPDPTRGVRPGELWVEATIPRTGAPRPIRLELRRE